MSLQQYEHQIRVIELMQQSVQKEKNIFEAYIDYILLALVDNGDLKIHSIKYI